MAPLLTPASVYRRYNTAGVPDSGKHDPDKGEIILLLDMLLGTASSPAVVKLTLTALDLVTPASENYGGIVLDDPDPTKNGYYSRSEGAWVKGRGFPDTFAQIFLTGPSNAQVGAASTGVNPADALVYFATVSEENAGPLTLSIGGEVARDVVNAAGNPLSAGEWAGTVVFFLNEDGDYQFLFDAGAAAAAAQSASDAEAARGAAQAIATQFGDVATAVGQAEAAADRAEDAADTLDFPPITLADAGKIVGINETGDGYEYVDASGGLPFVYLEEFGALGDGVANDNAAFVAALAALATAGGGTVRLKTTKNYLVNSGNIIPLKVNIVGDRFSSRITLADQVTTGLVCKGSNVLKDFDIHGTGIGDGTIGLALISIAGTSASDIITNVLIDGVRGRDAVGDGVRISDSQFVWILNTDWRVSRNPITINDDHIGTSWVWVDRIYGTGKIIGFACESDDDLYIVQNIWLSNFHFVLSGGGMQSGTTYGVGFTKSASGPQSSFLKHRNIHICDGKIDGFFFAIVIRGGDGISIRGVVAKSCTRGIEIGNLNAVRMCSISDCHIEATTNLCMIYALCDYITVHNNTFIGIGAAAAAGLYLISVQRIQVNNNMVIGVAGGSEALRATGCTGIFAYNMSNGGTLNVGADNSSFKGTGLNFIG